VLDTVDERSLSLIKKIILTSTIWKMSIIKLKKCTLAFLSKFTCSFFIFGRNKNFLLLYIFYLFKYLFGRIKNYKPFLVEFVTD